MIAPFNLLEYLRIEGCQDTEFDPLRQIYVFSCGLTVAMELADLHPASERWGKGLYEAHRRHHYHSVVILDASAVRMIPGAWSPVCYQDSREPDGFGWVKCVCEYAMPSVDINTSWDGPGGPR